MGEADIKHVLRQSLQQGLPGWKAHQVMATQVHEQARRQPPQNSRKAGVLMLLYPHAGHWWIPLILRPNYPGIHSGQMALPGGKVEDVDADIVATALRETHEEIGVQVQREQVLGILSDIYIPPSNISVTPVLALIEEVPAYLPDPGEVAEVVDIRLKDLKNPTNLSVREVGWINRAPLRAPAFKIKERIIWGATAMMLSEFLHILPELD